MPAKKGKKRPVRPQTRKPAGEARSLPSEAPVVDRCTLCGFVPINPQSKELQDHLRRVHHRG